MDVKNTIEQEKVDYTDYQSLLTKFLLILKEEYTEKFPQVQRKVLERIVESEFDT